MWGLHLALVTLKVKWNYGRPESILSGWLQPKNSYSLFQLPLLTNSAASVAGSSQKPQASGGPRTGYPVVARGRAQQIYPDRTTRRLQSRKGDITPCFKREICCQVGSTSPACTLKKTILMKAEFILFPWKFCTKRKLKLSP